MTFLYTNQLDWSSLKRKNSSVKGIFIIVCLVPMSDELVTARKNLLAIKSVGRINQTAVTFFVILMCHCFAQ